MKITIVGNMAFLDQFKKAKHFLEQQGHEIIVPEKDFIKRRSMEKFNENLKKSNAILVMNYTKDGKENYIGANTLMEIGMAFILQKKIFLLNPIPEFCKDELGAIGVRVLNGKLEQVK